MRRHISAESEPFFRMVRYCCALRRGDRYRKRNRVMLQPRIALRTLIDEPVVKIDWETHPKRGHELRAWRLVIMPASGVGPKVVIDTGVRTHRVGTLAEQTGATVLKAMACLVATLGPRVILPSGEEMPAEWIADAVTAHEHAMVVEVKRKRGRPRKHPLPEEHPHRAEGN